MPSVPADIEDIETIRGLVHQNTRGYASDVRSRDPRSQASEPSPASSSPAAPERVESGPVELGSYRLLSLLAQGGMGKVYRGEHVLLKREVAIKMLRDDLARDPDALDRFFAEARAVSQLGHEHIVEITDFVRDDERGLYYYVMKLLDGSDLSVLHASGTLTLGRSIDILLQVCSALDAVHAAGIVHRDLKPENIFVSNQGAGDHARLLDFGVAKLTEFRGPRSRQTLTGALLGTPSYMAPEQATGSTSTIDARTDIYALGVILFELTTGRLPFERDNLHTLLHDVIIVPPPVASSLAVLPPDCAPLVDALIERCMAKDPNARPQSVGEVALALSEIREHLRGADVLPLPRLEPLRQETTIRTARHQRNASPWGVRASFLASAAAAAALAGWRLNSAPLDMGQALSQRPPPVEAVLGAVAQPPATLAVPGRTEPAPPAPASIEVAATQAEPYASLESQRKEHRRRRSQREPAAGAEAEDEYLRSLSEPATEDEYLRSLAEPAAEERGGAGDEVLSIEAIAAEPQLQPADEEASQDFTPVDRDGVLNPFAP